MSVTFHCAGAPISYIQKPCDFPGCCPDEPCGYCDKGVMTERVNLAPELNLANANARILMDAILLPLEDPSDLWGELRPEEIAIYRQRILRARNRPEILGDYQRAEETGPRYHSCGLDTQGILSRLERLDAILAWAQEHNTAVVWN